MSIEPNFTCSDYGVYQDLRITSGLPVIRPQKRKLLGLYARVWGTKTLSDEERLQRNHHAISDVFI